MSDKSTAPSAESLDAVCKLLACVASDLGYVRWYALSIITAPDDDATADRNLLMLQHVIARLRKRAPEACKALTEDVIRQLLKARLKFRLKRPTAGPKNAATSARYQASSWSELTLKIAKAAAWWLRSVPGPEVKLMTPLPVPLPVTITATLAAAVEAIPEEAPHVADWIREEFRLVALCDATKHALNGKPSAKKTTRRAGNKRERQRRTMETIKRNAQLFADWLKAKKARVGRKDFAKDRGIDLGDFLRFLKKMYKQQERDRKEKERGDN